MAINSEDKRRSVGVHPATMLNILPSSDGSLDQGDRIHFAFLYQGISPQETAGPAEGAGPELVIGIL